MEMTPLSFVSELGHLPAARRSRQSLLSTGNDLAGTINGTPGAFAVM